MKKVSRKLGIIAALAISAGAMGITAYADGWMQNQTGYYYVYNGQVVYNNWLQDGSTYYYIDNTGYMVKGWKQINGVWYYFKDNGAMATGW